MSTISNNQRRLRRDVVLFLVLVNGVQSMSPRVGYKGDRDVPQLGEGEAGEAEINKRLGILAIVPRKIDCVLQITECKRIVCDVSLV